MSTANRGYVCPIWISSEVPTFHQDWRNLQSGLNVVWTRPMFAIILLRLLNNQIILLAWNISQKNLKMFCVWKRGECCAVSHKKYKSRTQLRWLMKIYSSETISLLYLTRSTACEIHKKKKKIVFYFQFSGDMLKKWLSRYVCCCRQQESFLSRFAPPT